MQELVENTTKHLYQCYAAVDEPEDAADVGEGVGGGGKNVIQFNA